MSQISVTFICMLKNLFQWNLPLLQSLVNSVFLYIYLYISLFSFHFLLLFVYSDLDIVIHPPEGDPPATWWDEECDKSLLIGVYKYGEYHYAFPK